MIHGGVAVVSDPLEEVLLALAARGSVHAARGADPVRLAAVAGLAGLGALAAGALAAVAGARPDVTVIGGTPQLQRIKLRAVVLQADGDEVV